MDGITSSTLVLDVLEAHGLDALWHVPDRRSEGYGLNEPAIRAIAQRSRLMVTAYSAPVVSRLVAMRQRYRMSRPSMQPMTMWVFPMSSARIMTLPPYFPFCTAVLRAASLPRLNTTALAITAPVKKHTMASTRPLMPTKAMMNRNGLALPSASTKP